MTDPALLQNGQSQGQALYDALMSAIEPELVTAELPLLAERYHNETPADRTKRAERFYRAFEAYEKKLEQLTSQSGEVLSANMRSALASLEQEDRVDENEEIGDILKHISSL